MKPNPNRHLVLWDGDCGFCRRSIAWLKRHDKGGVLAFEPYQSAPISPELKMACEKAVHVITKDGEILRAGKAALFAGRATKWRRLARLLEHRPWIWFVEIGYWIVARNRQFFSRFLFQP